MRHKLIGLLEQSPVIPAVKDETALTRAAGCESRVLFLLGGDLLTIRREKGRLGGFTIGFCGDLKFGRNYHGEE